METRQIVNRSGHNEICIPRQRAARATERQINGLIDAMMEDLELAHSIVRAVDGKKLSNMRWAALAKKLNRDYGGAPKKPAQWQKLWQNMKRRTMNRLRDWRAAGKDETFDKPLTATEVKVAMVFKKKDGNGVKSEPGGISASLLQDVEQLDLDVESPQHSSDNEDSGSDSQMDSFPGWGEPLRPSTPTQQSQRSVNPAGQNGTHLDPIQDPFASTMHPTSEIFPQFMERLLQLEESRQRSETQREEHRVWCDRRYAELEENRQALEERRLQYEESRLQLDRRRLEMDEAMHATWREMLSKK